MTPSQSFLRFEQATRDAELAAAVAKLQAKLAAQAAGGNGQEPPLLET